MRFCNVEELEESKGKCADEINFKIKIGTSLQLKSKANDENTSLPCISTGRKMHAHTTFYGGVKINNDKDNITADLNNGEFIEFVRQ